MTYYITVKELKDGRAIIVGSRNAVPVSVIGVTFKTLNEARAKLAEILIFDNNQHDLLMQGVYGSYGDMPKLPADHFNPFSIVTHINGKPIKD